MGTQEDKKRRVGRGTEYEGMRRRNRRGRSSRRISGNVDSSQHPSNYVVRITQLETALLHYGDACESVGHCVIRPAAAHSGAAQSK